MARGTTLQLDSCIWWRCLIYMSGNWTILVLLVLQGGDDLVRLRPCYSGFFFFCMKIKTQIDRSHMELGL